MSFSIPMNDMIGPSITFSLAGGAVVLAFVAVAYRAFLQRQEDAWAKADKE